LTDQERAGQACSSPRPTECIGATTSRTLREAHVRLDRLITVKSEGAFRPGV